MVPYDKIVLNKLLDSYESSLLSTGKNERAIHIEWRFTKKNILVYFGLYTPSSFTYIAFGRLYHFLI